MVNQYLQAAGSVPTRSPEWQRYMEAEGMHTTTVPPTVPPMENIEQEHGDPQFRQRFYGYGTGLLAAAALGMNWALTSQNNYGPPRI